MSDNTFFIVEDHTTTNLGIRQLLQEKLGITCAGFAYTTAEAEEKLAALASAKADTAETALPDLVILDLFLGKESGIDLLKTIRKNYPSVKVLVHSMYAKPGILSLALEEGANGFVEKAAPEKVLLNAVRSILTGENFIQQNLVPSLFTYKTMYDGLTKQEQKIMKMLLGQKTKEQISEELNIVPHTVDNYLSRIFDKTACHSISELLEKFAKG
ncbi:MAG: response regulator transcription factor [Treponema sp.]|nr:response regulator transcription factor [Candidatus Treponema caballi]